MLEIPADAFQDLTGGIAGAPLHGIFFTAVQQRIPFLRLDFFRHLEDVRALVAVLREPSRLPADLLVSSEYGEAQGSDLATGIVDIVFLLHRKTAECEDIGHAVTHGRPPAVAHMQRAGGVGTHELHLDLAAAAEIRFPVAGVGSMNVVQHRKPGPGADEEINEAGTGDLGLFEQVIAVFNIGDDGFGDLSRGHLLLGCSHQGEIGGQIAVGFRLGLVDDDGRKIRRFEFAPIQCPGGGGANNGTDTVFHFPRVHEMVFALWASLEVKIPLPSFCQIYH